MNAPVRVLFVCFGNLCRSPLAQAVFLGQVRDTGLAGRIVASSAGFCSHLEGRPFHPLTRRICEERNLPLEGTSRTVTPSDLLENDYILAMDETNLSGLFTLDQYRRHRSKIHLLREYGSVQFAEAPLVVPDPMGGGPEEFELAYMLIDDACRGLLAAIRAEHGI